MKVLVTGCAGFIGSQLSIRLLNAGFEVLGIDSLNSYYDTRLKMHRLQPLLGSPNFSFKVMDINDLLRIWESVSDITHVVHLAAQAGVRYSIDFPEVYRDSNLSGFFSVLEYCKLVQVEHLIYASSSSVYGANVKVPFSEDDDVSLPMSLYAATKRADELLAESYSHLYGIPMTGLRFFTVYGPWGRPDMAIFKFVDLMTKGNPIEVYANGALSRDFTHIDDIVEGMYNSLFKIPSILELKNRGIRSDENAQHIIINLGRGNPHSVNELIAELEAILGLEAMRIEKPMQMGDVVTTFADISRAGEWLSYSPKVSLREGLESFCDWYLDYNQVQI